MGTSHCEEHGGGHRRKQPRREKSRKMSPQQISDTTSAGCTPPGTICPHQSIKEKSSKAWENIVLHYLSKLKNVWRASTPLNENEMAHPVTPAKRECSAKKFRRERHNEHRKLHYSKYNPRSPTVSTVPSNFCLSGKKKAFNIVANAIEYGLAHGIVSKNGNFFWLSHKLRKNKRMRKIRSLCSKCKTCCLTMPSSSNTAADADVEKDQDLGHALAVNKSRPKVSKIKSVLNTNNLKVKQVGSAKVRSPRSVRSVKSHKSRGGLSIPKVVPKDSVALAGSKSKKSVRKVTSALRSEYMNRLTRAKTKERDCRCPRCLKKYSLW